VSTADERIAHLERQVEMLLAEIAVLKAENAELRRRLGQNSSNSSKPPSSDSPADREKRPSCAPTASCSRATASPASLPAAMSPCPSPTGASRLT
jgi:hypothetical protein